MNFFDNYLNFDVKKSMGICNVTDEFFCLLLSKIYSRENKNCLVVVNSLFEANKLYNSLATILSSSTIIIFFKYNHQLSTNIITLKLLLLSYSFVI